MSSRRYILGIDPSLKHLGYALLYIEGRYGSSLECAGEADLSSPTGQDRFSAVLHACQLLGAGFVGIAWETAPFGAAHGRSEAVGQRIRRGQAEAVGTIRGMALAMQLPILKPVNVSTAKKTFASTGHADKAHMIAAATMRFGVTLPEHAADACAIAHTALQLVVTDDLVAMRRVAKGR